MAGRSQRHLKEFQGYDSNMRRDPSPPTEITLTPATIVAAAANGTVVGVLAAVGDLDVSEEFSFEITGGTDQASFAVGDDEGDPVIEKAGALTAGAKQIIVTVTDRFGETYSETLEITATA